MYKTWLLVLALCCASSLVMAQAGAAGTSQDYSVNREGKQKITNGPVVEYTSDHSAMIAWSTKLPAGTYLAYGTNQNNLSQRTNKAWGGTNHRLEIKNLQPSTTYYFQVRSENAKGTGDDVQSPVASFTTVAKGAAPDRQNKNVGVKGSSGTLTNASATTSGTQYLPLYRMYGQGGHFYTTDARERTKWVSGGQYKDEGTAGHLATSSVPGTTEFYRLVAERTGTVDHFYTANPSERRSAMAGGYRDEGSVGYISTTQQPGTVPLYRLLGKSGDHFYTTDANERRTVIANGYKDEGIAGYVWTSAQGSNESFAQQ